MFPVCRSLSHTARDLARYHTWNRAPIDLSLYLVADCQWAKNDEAYFSRIEALMPYVSRIQYRDQARDFEQSVKTASKLQSLLHDSGIGLDISNRIDVAKEIGASGFFLERSDLTFEEVRAFLGAGVRIGLPVHTEEDVRRVEEQDVSFISVKVMPSRISNPTGSAHWGIQGLEWVRAHSSHQIVAIGGINLTNCASVASELNLRTDGVAMVGEAWRNGDVALLQKIRAILRELSAQGRL